MPPMENKYLFHYTEETNIPTFGVLIAGHFHCSYGFYGHRTKGTKDWLMIYTARGEGSFRVDREVTVSRQGDLVIIPPGIPHHYAANADTIWEILWVHFVPVAEQLPHLKLPRTAEQLIHFPLEEPSGRLRIEQAFQRLVQDSLDSSKIRQDLAMLALSEILILLHEMHTKPDKGPQLDERVETILKVLSDDLREKHRTSDLASLVNLSSSRLSHLVKEQTGASLTDLLIQMRLQRAAKLLRFTARPVNVIADEVGFDSPPYFTRRFTEQFGMSPTAYRKLVNLPGLG